MPTSTAGFRSFRGVDTPYSTYADSHDSCTWVSIRMRARPSCPLSSENYLDARVRQGLCRNSVG